LERRWRARSSRLGSPRSGRPKAERSRARAGRQAGGETASEGPNRFGSRGRWPGHEPLAQGRRELERRERAVVEDAAQHGRDGAARDRLAGVRELEGVADRGAADALDGDADLDLVLEADGAE